MSTSSGIPDFRGPGGLWQRYDVEQVSTVEGLRRDPERFFSFWMERFERMRQAAPNYAHRYLASLEQRGRLAGVITQNIDGLHQSAGSQRVVEVHGHVRSGSCLDCTQSYSFDWVAGEARAKGAAWCPCGGPVKPDVVLFGEQLPPAMEEALRAIQDADLLLVLGTSLTVWPVAGLVPQASAWRVPVVMVNNQPTEYDGLAEVVLRGDVEEACRLLSHLGEGRGAADDES